MSKQNTSLSSDKCIKKAKSSKKKNENENISWIYSVVF